jgi:hypothetical protein
MNLDSLPDELCPTDGCPDCGSVWVDVTSVGIVMPYHARGRLVRVFGDQWVVDVAPILAPVRAVRLRCFGEHLVEFDGKKFLSWPYSWGGVASYVAPMYAMVKQ